MKFDLHGLTPVEAIRAYPEQALEIMQKQDKELAQNTQLICCGCGSDRGVSSINICYRCFDFESIEPVQQQKHHCKHTIVVNNVCEECGENVVDVDECEK